MQQFNLDTWLQDRNRKVVTRDGRSVRIICTDSPDNEYPIVGFVDGDLEPQTWDLYGKYNHELSNGSYNLFFADEEEIKLPLTKELEEYFKNTPKEQIEKDWKEIQDWYNQHFANESNEEEELTEFEKAVDNIINYPHFQDEQAVKQFSKTLLDLARKEIEKDNVIIDKDRYLKICDQYYNNGKKNALKDLPKLEKTNAAIDPTIPVMYTHATTMKTYIEYDGYKVCINDLFEKLQKEE